MANQQEHIETVEEAARIYANSFKLSEHGIILADQAFTEGAKWQKHQGYIPYQICPKCIGKKQCAPDFDSTSILIQCNVCEGKSVIPMYYQQEEKTPFDEMDLREAFMRGRERGYSDNFNDWLAEYKQEITKTFSDKVDSEFQDDWHNETPH